MRKLIVLCLFIIASISLNAQQKYLIYCTRIAAELKNDSLTNKLKPYWRIQGDKITTTYSVVKANKDNSKFAVPVVPGTEKYFNKKDTLNFVLLDDSFN